jgi:phosphatidylglycerol:prolipoprotein diacylglycerol transferase
MFPEPVWQWSLGPWQGGVTLYGITLSVAYVLGAVLILCDRRDPVLGRRIVLDVLPITVASGFLVSTLSKSWLYGWCGNHEGGTHFLGWAIGGVAGAMLYARCAALPGRVLLDIVLPCVLIGSALGRLGCLCAGCCCGIPCAPPLGWSFPAHGPAGVPVLPVQLLSATWDAACFLWVVAWLRRRQRYPGQVALACMACYCTGRWCVEFLRTEPRLLPGSSVAQCICVAVLVLLPWIRARWRAPGRAALQPR